MEIAFLTMATRDDVVTCFLGSGAVVGAWEPVMDAVRSMDDFPGVASEQAANFVMARVVYLARWVVSDSARRAADQEGAEGGFEEAHKDVHAVLTELREKIAERLRTAENAGQLRVRPEFNSVVETFVTGECSMGSFITTNWDRTVADALRSIDDRFEVGFLHGSVADHEKLYLPTEIADEPYREQGEAADLAYRHRQLIDHVADSTRLVFYGLSVSPLDAELAQMIAAGAHESPLQEIIVVDPNYREVAERIGTLVAPAAEHVVIKGYHPAHRRVADEWELARPRRA